VKIFEPLLLLIDPSLRFPDNPITFKTWCRKIREVFLVKEKMYDQRVCSLHFEAKDFVDENTRDTLKPKAVPIVHDYKHYFKGETKKLRTDMVPENTCYLCHMLKNWKVELKPKKEPVKLFQ
jgi:THAP domain